MALTPDTRKELLAIQEKKALVEQKRKEQIEGLPHRHRYKWYQWAWDFYKSRNHMNLLFAGNQVSKSSTMIRKCIEWAGNQTLWPTLWPGKTPNVFWYMYPSQPVINAEWHAKWVAEFMPRGVYKDHPSFGWKVIRDGDDIKGIKFNSGVIVYFKTYSQNLQNLQSTSVYAIFADEELPVEVYDEINARQFGTDGYFHMGATPTLNQHMWRMAAEGKGQNEIFPDAFKQQISMFDCVVYMDGTQGAYTEEKIKRIIASCKSRTEVLRRVYGKFVTEEGRKYASYEPERHYIAPKVVPRNWNLYSAVDLGSGGEKGHPPAIAFVAASKDFREGLVYRVWRGDDGKDYTMGDVFKKYLELRGEESIIEQRYDQQAKDFKTIAARAGETFLPSNKSHEDGEDVVTSLFKSDMLHILASEEAAKLSDELLTLMRDTDKKKAKDDLCDALRYCVVSIPWDWSFLKKEPTDEEKEAAALLKRKKPLTEVEAIALEIDERRARFIKPGAEDSETWGELEEEFYEWNQMYGN